MRVTEPGVPLSLLSLGSLCWCSEFQTYRGDAGTRSTRGRGQNLSPKQALTAENKERQALETHMSVANFITGPWPN